MFYLNTVNMSDRKTICAVRAYRAANNEVADIVKSCMSRLFACGVKAVSVYDCMRRAGVPNVDFFIKFIRHGDFNDCTYLQVYTYRFFVDMLCDLAEEERLHSAMLLRDMDMFNRQHLVG